MNNKIVSIKTTSAIFLAIVLVTGTFAAISPLFIINGANAQGDQPYYGSGMDNNNYEKSKDISKSISVNKIKCINDNININGVNDGNISIGNKKGQGYLGANSYGGYYDGYHNNKKDKGFECIINNNNNNINVIGGGNVTDGGGNVTDQCSEDVEACFQEFLPESVFLALETALESQAGITIEINGQNVTLRSFEDICLALEGLTHEQLGMEIVEIIRAVAPVRVGVDLLECIAEALDIEIPPMR